MIIIFHPALSASGQIPVKDRGKGRLAGNLEKPARESDDRMIFLIQTRISPYLCFYGLYPNQTNDRS